jgi:organic hydroperoxide reductase OsmC/OhrA
MSNQHHYELQIIWIGNDGEGTRGYTSYRRDHIVVASGKPEIAGSSDPAFRGDPSRYNPEELLVASLSSCHMLWYLHLCGVSQVVVVSYEDKPRGVMEEDSGGSGRFTEVELRPTILIASGSDPVVAAELHHEAHLKCFIANSVNFPVRVLPTINTGHVTGSPQ